VPEKDKSKLILPYRDVPEDLDASVSDGTPLPNSSEVFLKNDLAGEGVKAIYNKRLNYASEVLEQSENYSNVVNFNFAEKHLYGRVNRVFTPIIPAGGGALELVPVYRNDSITNTFMTFNFVADNFKELSNQFRKAIAMKKISPVSPFLSDLKVYKAYQDPRLLFRAHSREYDQGMKDLFIDDNVQVTNFDEFIVKLMPYLERTAKEHPFTLTAFVKSRYCPITTSGLALEIADIKPSEDLAKIEQFVGSVTWDYYLNACQTYGFMVDRLYPWRLVADIASTPMLKKSAQYGIKTTDSILLNGYEMAHRLYFNGFANRLLQLYNMVKKPKTRVMDCGDSMRVSSLKPTDYTPASLVSKYGVLFMFRVYCAIRFYEEESPFSPHERQKLVEDCMEIARHGVIPAVDVFERILNKTFDYMGSLQYIRERFDKLDLRQPE